MCVDLAGAVRAERRAVERLARPARSPARLGRRAQQLLDLDDEVVARAQPDAVTETATTEPDFGVTVMLGCARSPQVCDAGIDAEDERSAEHEDAERQYAALLVRALLQTEGRDGAEEHGEAEAECAEARERMDSAPSAR